MGVLGGQGVFAVIAVDIQEGQRRELVVRFDELRVVGPIKRRGELAAVGLHRIDCLLDGPG
jgi:hypothetical protein